MQAAGRSTFEVAGPELLLELLMSLLARSLAISALARHLRVASGGRLRTCLTGEVRGSTRERLVRLQGA
ncbi:hypothetical protein STHU_40350 [Allostella humosa]|nr:hypothetical protein STHU_40350 [Stella humosa]